MPVNTYVGSELDVFALAQNWKGYVRDLAAPYLRGDILEVGAGIGGTSVAFRNEAQSSWTALEPDAALAARLRDRAAAMRSPVRAVVGMLGSTLARPIFDAVIYIDVLEHIEKDGEELREAAARLRTNGAIVVMSPAHQALFSPFDEAIGHFRRYDRKSLQALTPPGTRLVSLRYLDSVGLTLTVGNRLVLRSASPTVSQVKFWDRFCIPMARRIDPLLGGRVGKSIMAVWRRT